MRGEPDAEGVAHVALLGGADEVDEGGDDPGGAAGPETAERPQVAAGHAVEDAVVPAGPAEGVGGVVAEDIGDALDLALDEGVGVLGEEVDVTEALRADLADEFAEGGGVGEVDVGVGFAAVAVAAGDDGAAEGEGEGEGALVFRPGAEAIQFERVDPAAATFEGAAGEEIMAFGADALFVPAGVIEDDEHLLVPGDPFEEFAEAGLGCRVGVFGHGFHHGVGAGGRQVVYAEVEEAVAEGDGPLHGDGRVAGFLDQVEASGGVDGVVVGEGDEGGKAEGLELRGFERVGLLGRERGRPMGVVEIEIAGRAGRGTCRTGGRWRS